MHKFVYIIYVVT